MMGLSPMTSGPHFIVIGVNTSTGLVPNYQLRALGTTQNGVDIQHNVQYIDVPDDKAGSAQSFDDMYGGEGPAILGMTFTDFDERVMQILERIINLGNKSKGSDDALDRGSLMLTEGLTWPVYLIRGHRLKPSMIAQGMLAGLRYPYCRVDSIQVIEGRKANMKRVNFLAKSKYIRQTGRFHLYDHDVTQAAAVAFT